VKENKKPKTQIPHCDFLEVLAFELRMVIHTAGATGDVDPGTERDNWQAEVQTRKNWRHDAAMLLTHLENAGIAVKVSKSAKLQKALQFIVTQPEKIAYRPLDESN
jgi:hypothetical protein